MKIKLSVYVAVIVMLSFFSFRYMLIPDPEDYAKLFLTTIKKNNKEEYLKVFGMTSKEIAWVGNRMLNDAHINAEEKAEYTRNLADTAQVVADINERLSEGYDLLTQWIQTEKINLNELEFIRIYYELEYERRGMFHVLDDADLIVKHKDRYYNIVIRDAGYVNGRWVFGRVREIDEFDQYFDVVAGGYGNEIYADTTAVAEYYTADSVAVAYEDYAIDTAYAVYEEPQLTKKQQKIQKKIDALNRKEYQLYDEMYKEVYK